ncbi:50S ribosomal protein L11 methyltransferase [Aureimonas leprariae]|uniref:Ribosomal protein L11 methyltransferase n=1 Tax=Plantimonas leprariae TaxID=2615207 RepID=A0A7V7TXV7_9HYPH|nr:50S ribosomal protein L11 methyltransferase [Aureimonas leprariae]KAB0681941.1 50S ribosomal protein L11 methyltransferase [Aureimonas leprariae]
MPQTRFFTRAGRVEAGGIFDAWDRAFEEEGAPVGVIEIDEAADIHEVSVYFDGDADPEREAEVREAAKAASEASVSREDIPDTDWMAQVLADLKPVRAGRFVVHGSHDRASVRPNEISIEIEAGQAFGTGHHGTTAGCLEMIDRIARRRRPQNVLDLGTGTAVLAIGAAKLVRAPVLATDIDPVAVAVARSNIELNRASGFVRTAVAMGLQGPAVLRAAPFDLIVANILAGPLMRLAPSMRHHLAAGGDIVLSGILARQRDAVLAAYRIQGLFHRRTIRRDEWVTLHLTR